MSRYVVVGTSPFEDHAVAVGPFESAGRFGMPDANTEDASYELEARGWLTQIVELRSPDQMNTIPEVVNDEGAGS